MTTNKHKIQWLNLPGYKGETWNPLLGCKKVSEGCANCYATKMAHRLMHMHTTDYMFVLKDNGESDPEKFKYLREWNGQSHAMTKAFRRPFNWKSPHVIFVCSMGDLFFEKHSYDYIDKVFAVMASNPQHIFIVLTKRPKNMLEWFNWKDESWQNKGMQGNERIRYYCYHDYGVKIEFKDWKWPLQNVWLGVTVEEQKHIQRIDYLLHTPAAKRLVSVEPMLSAIEFDDLCHEGQLYDPLGGFGDINRGSGKKLDWVICGGESGHKARPMHPDWVRSIRDQCKAAKVPFFFKQWGEYLLIEETAQPPFYRAANTGDEFDSHGINFYDPETGEPGKWMGHKFIEDLNTPGGMYWNAGRKLAGNLLDGVKHEQYPQLETQK
jgi:protein gp37